MPAYRYKAIGNSGRIEVGTIESDDRSAAVASLQAQGFLPIEADVATAGGLSRFSVGNWRKRGISSRQLGLALQELSVLLDAGLPLDRALELLASETATRQLKPVLNAMLASVRGGASLAESASAYPRVFGPSLTTLIEAGETGGTLETSLLRAADILLRAAAVRETIAGALLYPVILLMVAGLSLTIILTVVIPRFKPLFEDAGARLPLPTRIVMAFGDGVTGYWWLALLVAAAAAAIARQGLRRPEIRLYADTRLLRLPLVGQLLSKIEIARFARTLGTLVENGIPLPAAIGISHRGFSNTALARAVDQVGKSLKEGEGLARPLEATQLFPRTALHLIRVGEETARLGDMLERLAEILDREVQRHVQRTLALMVPLITIGLGVLIAGIIASILVAVLSLNDLAIIK